MQDGKQNHSKNTWGLKGLFFGKWHKNHLLLGILRSRKGDRRGNILKAINKRQKISLSHFELAYFLENSTPGEFAYTSQNEQVGIITLKFQRARSHF